MWIVMKGGVFICGPATKPCKKKSLELALANYTV